MNGWITNAANKPRQLSKFQFSQQPYLQSAKTFDSTSDGNQLGLQRVLIQWNILIYLLVRCFNVAQTDGLEGWALNSKEETIYTFRYILIIIFTSLQDIIIQCFSDLLLCIMLCCAVLLLKQRLTVRQWSVHHQVNFQMWKYNIPPLTAHR